MGPSCCWTPCPLTAAGCPQPPPRPSSQTSMPTAECPRPPVPQQLSLLLLYCNSADAPRRVLPPNRCAAFGPDPALHPQGQPPAVKIPLPEIHCHG